MGREEAVVGQGPPLLAGVVDGGDGRPPAAPAPPGAPRPRAGRSIVRRRRCPARASRADSARRGAVPPTNWRRVVARRRWMWASCSQVKPMPPEDLDGALGGLHVAVEGQGCGELDGQAGPGPARRPDVGAVLGLEDRGRVPGGGHPLLHRDQHVGQPVLDPLELADRPAELLSGAGVLGRRVEAPAGPPDRLGRSTTRARSRIRPWSPRPAPAPAPTAPRPASRRRTSGVTDRSWPAARPPSGCSRRAAPTGRPGHVDRGQHMVTTAPWTSGPIDP